ncbi:MAG: nucleotidyltransferase substrate binding protein [Candidatus Caenarcaniphilales bacterium]|nr:nucleotidyltransferase substrate binding protein [Candidatus Caenarcaniphilales bacterium]
MNLEKARWIYRFENFRRAYFLLRESIEKKQEEGLNQLEKEGVIQRFEYSLELAWKVMKDFLEEEKVLLINISPKVVIKEAFATKLIANGEIWMEAYDARNKMSHTYDFQKFELVIEDIENKYLEIFGDLYETLASRL